MSARNRPPDPPDPAAGAARLLALCRSRALSLVTAESCTGGLVGAAITGIPGASRVYAGGFISYSNRAKRQMLGVRAATLAEFGAVSEAVAAEMAAGARRAGGADLALAVTGIAGPGGAAHKPEGRVCFALATGADLRAETVDFGARGRERVRRAAAAHGLALLTEAAENYEK